MIINDDILNWCKEYKGEKFHSLICDPPYHLTMDKRWANETKPTPAMEGKVFERQTKGFMGKSWDGGDIAFRKETWEALKEHLYPGAFCFAFASTRGLHRMMVAIEDAGFVIHPTIFLYAFGSGFPKATRIDTQIQSKEEQEVVGECNRHNGRQFAEGQSGFAKGKIIIKEPTDPIAKRWTSHRYGLQALKPAVEPIICFQKRYEGKPVNCIVETGAGALNIDGSRIGITTRMTHGTFNKSGKCIEQNVYSGKWADGYISDSIHGRWPSNLIIDKECAERFPMTDGNGYRKNAAKTYEGGGETYSKNFNAFREAGRGFDDVGSAARYFKNVEMKIDAADPVFYTSKVSKEERNKGCEGMVEKEVKVSVHQNATCGICGRFIRADYGEKGCQCKKPIIAKQNITNSRNVHPCLKSIDLTTYLATLLLPPLEYAPRRILVPFAGAGSEMIGCLKAGWEEIVGIELTTEYIPIIEARFEYYRKQIELEKEQQLFEPEIMESMNKANKAEESLFGTK